MKTTIFWHTLANRSFKNNSSRIKFSSTNQSGATLVEGLMAGVIIAAASVMSVIAANGIIALVNSTDTQSKFSAIIDNDISRIRAIAQQYNSCSDPSGSVSAAGAGCTGYSESSSYYYFPDPTTSSGPSDVASFDAACESPTTAGHIVEKFITAAQGTSIPPEIQKTVSRKDPSNPSNNLVVVTYAAPGGLTRESLISPYLAYWCR